MSEAVFLWDSTQLIEWYKGIGIANRNNILCHCRSCDREWIDSVDDATCIECNSKDVEHISCWQFPDD
jgi:anaerobic ribonucleoside-triphosphate reductase